MLYIARITIPPNTQEDNPVEETITLEGDYLQEIQYLFPFGQAQTAKVRVYYGARQISPANEEWVDGNGETVSDIIKMELPERKTTLRILGYSTSTKYQHTVTLRFQVLNEEQVTRTSELINLFKKLLGIR